MGKIKIKIVSPSGAIDPEYIDRAAEVLRGWGYEVSEAAHARGKVGRFAASDDDRMADLADALADPAVDMVLCARGGYGLQRIIDRIPPIHKPIIGFSDITALHLLAARTGQVTIHAPMCKGIAAVLEPRTKNQEQRRDTADFMEVRSPGRTQCEADLDANGAAWRPHLHENAETKVISPSSKESPSLAGEDACVPGQHPSSMLQRALAHEALHYELPAHPLNREGKIKGTLVGGNLSVLYGLQGTEYGLDERLRIKDKRLNSVVDEGLRIKDERLNSNDYIGVVGSGCKTAGETPASPVDACAPGHPSAGEDACAAGHHPAPLPPPLLSGEAGEFCCAPGHPLSSPILFIEDVGERHYHIDRMMNNLRLSGVLANISGLIVGQFSDCEDDPSMGCTVYETIRHAVEPYRYPVVFNFPAGHTEENMPIYLNAPVEIEVREDYSSSIHSFFKSS
ncbi:MAG: LD-carboxypeptidase [Paludibacteraceae bacterium]